MNRDEQKFVPGPFLHLVLFLVLCKMFSPTASAQTYVFGRADFPTSIGPQSAIVADFLQPDVPADGSFPPLPSDPVSRPIPPRDHHVRSRGDGSPSSIGFGRVKHNSPRGSRPTSKQDGARQSRASDRRADQDSSNQGARPEKGHPVKGGHHKKSVRSGGAGAARLAAVE